MTPQTIALVAAIAGHLLAIARLFNAFRPLYGWLPPKAQPVVIAAVAGLPPLAAALTEAKSLEQVLLAVASGLTAFFMAVKGSPPAPPSSGSSSSSTSDPEPTRVPVWRDSPDEPAELSARPGVLWAFCPVLQLAPLGCAALACLVLALVACGPRQLPCDESKLRAADAAYLARVATVCLPFYSSAAECPEYPALKADHRRELRSICPQ
jgi:hypothetical protein